MATMEWAAARQEPGAAEEAGKPGDRVFFYDGVVAGRDVRAGLSRRSAAARPLPMEDLCFFVKRIDNSRLLRVLDPHSRGECLKMVACVSTVCLLALLYIVPYLSLLRSGYQIEELKRENEALVEAGRQLQIKEAELRDPSRIARIAHGQLGLLEPSPEQIFWQEAGASQPGAGELLARDLSPRRREAK